MRNGRPNQRLVGRRIDPFFLLSPSRKPKGVKMWYAYIRFSDLVRVFDRFNKMAELSRGLDDKSKPSTDACTLHLPRAINRRDTVWILNPRGVRWKRGSYTLRTYKPPAAVSSEITLLLTHTSRVKSQQSDLARPISWTRVKRVRIGKSKLLPPPCLVFTGDEIPRFAGTIGFRRNYRIT